MTTRPTPTPWPSFLVNGSLGILIGRAANTAHSSNDQIAPIPPNDPPEKVVKRRLSASSATTENRNAAFNRDSRPGPASTTVVFYRDGGSERRRPWLGAVVARATMP